MNAVGPSAVRNLSRALFGSGSTLLGRTENIAHCDFRQWCFVKLLRVEGYTLHVAYPRVRLTMPAKRQRPPEDPDESLGHRLARLRKERGITQAELAERLKISQTTVSDYERGRLRMHGDVILALARLLNISADDLLGLEATPQQPVVKDRKLLQHLALIERLPKRDRDALLRTIRLYVSRAQ
jgi:transcriptional regulator with XRE-family HTH domain